MNSHKTEQKIKYQVGCFVDGQFVRYDRETYDSLEAAQKWVDMLNGIDSGRKWFVKKKIIITEYIGSEP